MTNILNSNYQYILIWLSVLIALIVVPLILIITLKKDENEILNKYRAMFESEEEALAAYNRDKLNITISSNDKKRSLFMILAYVVIFFVLATIIQYIAIFIYLGVNKYPYDIIVEGSEIYNEKVFEHMSNILNVILQVVIYLMILAAAIIICRKMFINDLKKFRPKYLANAAMGFGLVYAGSMVGQILLTVLGVTNFKGEATNQEAINAMFSQGPLAILALFLVTVIIAPIVEEIVFRKCIFNLFSDRKMGLYVSTIAFGLLHVVSPIMVAVVGWISGEAAFIDIVLELMYLIPYSLMGLGMGIAYMKSNNNILAPILTHTANNLVSFIISLLMVLFPQFFQLLIVFLK